MQRNWLWYVSRLRCLSINVVVSFLPLSFAPSGAGTYTLTINQVTITP